MFTFRATLRSLSNFPLSEYRDAVKGRSEPHIQGFKSGDRYTGPQFQPLPPLHAAKQTAFAFEGLHDYQPLGLAAGVTHGCFDAA
jgi:hypothetical protein